MTFIFALFLVPAIFVTYHLFGHNGIAAVLLGAPFAVPALAILEAILEGLAGLLRR